MKLALPLPPPSPPSIPPPPPLPRRAARGEGAALSPSELQNLEPKRPPGAGLRPRMPPHVAVAAVEERAAAGRPRAPRHRLAERILHRPTAAAGAREECRGRARIDARRDGHGGSGPLLHTRSRIDSSLNAGPAGCCRARPLRLYAPLPQFSPTTGASCVRHPPPPGAPPPRPWPALRPAGAQSGSTAAASADQPRGRSGAPSPWRGAVPLPWHQVQTGQLDGEREEARRWRRGGRRESGARSPRPPIARRETVARGFFGERCLGARGAATAVTVGRRLLRVHLTTCLFAAIHAAQERRRMTLTAMTHSHPRSCLGATTRRNNPGRRTGASRGRPAERLPPPSPAALEAGCTTSSLPSCLPSPSQPVS